VIVDAELVRRLFTYDHANGALIWQEPMHRQVRVVKGQIAGYVNLYSRCIVIMLDGKNYKAHRLIWLYVTGSWPVNCIDHINGDPYDNRFDNLRDVTHQVNLQNIRKASRQKKRSSLLGAFRNHNKWMSRIKVNGKDKYLGNFETEEEAHAAYLAAKRKYHIGCTI
jgi:HNH endonuclease